ncbi:hypothetical protein LUQ84_002557 [Hamiltosporidium tvaerminnensis]|nr:hypothetical protein LUQ84_002557 [Hamiltosporidium tvaerminnensis]
MNLESIYKFQKKDTLKNMYIWVSFFYIFIFMKKVWSYRFNYSFIINMESDILFFRENQEEILLNEEIDNDFGFEIFYDSYIKHVNQDNCIFRCTKENFVNFEELNNISFSNSTKNKFKIGIVGCSYELSHILKITNDITEMPLNMSNYQFKCILKTLKSLKAVENKNMLKLLQVLIFNYFVHNLYNGSERKPLLLQETFQDDFFENLEFSTTKNFIFAFLNIFMIKYSFENGNIILVDKCKEYYDNTLLNKNIPYKNILINNFKVVYILENIFKNRCILCTFQILLNYLSMKSLIVDNYTNLEIYEQNYNFAIFSINVFKSISISNFTNQSAVRFLDRLSAVIRNDLEFLCLINLQITRNAIRLFLNQKKLRGLVLRGIRKIEDVDFIQDYTDCGKKLEYIDFKNVILKDTWWNYFLQVSNVSKLILCFCTLLQQNFFLKEFVKIVSDKDILYFEVNFCYSEISIDFYHSLFYFKSLRTLKIRRYKNTEITERLLYKAIENMSKLVCLKIKQEYICTALYISNLLTSQIRSVHLERFFSCAETPMFYFLNQFKSITKLSLVNINIAPSSLIEIFQLKNLRKLLLMFCTIKKIKIKPESLNSMSNYISSLDLCNTNLGILKNVDILWQFDYLENLNLSACKLPPGYLANLSLKCNLRLKKLSYESSTLDSTDLLRIANLEILEQLNLSKCKFLKTSFCRLRNKCKFISTLKKLDLWFVKMNAEDLSYLRNFIKLEKLSLTFFCLNPRTIQNSLPSRPILHISTRVLVKNLISK